MHKTGTIYGINGPVIYLKGNTGFQMAEMVYVGKERLVGEVIRLTNDITTIQVFEETTGLRPGDPVEATGDAISVTLGPGILNNIFDGIERPLSEIAKSSGKYISRGVSVDSLDTEKKWQTHITVKPGEFVSGGTIIAEVQETQAIVHKSMVPPNISGTVLEVAMDGEYTINEPIVTVQLANGKEEKLTLAQKWPIRVPRPTAARFAASKPLITGQRILDTLFPIAKGGTAAIPGGFGTGKTMTQHQIAKWSNADIIIYIGCGELLSIPVSHWLSITAIWVTTLRSWQTPLPVGLRHFESCPDVWKKCLQRKVSLLTWHPAFPLSTSVPA